MVKSIHKFIVIPVFLIAYFTAYSALLGQNIINPDLDGTVGISSFPNSWQNIPHTSIMCNANDISRCTPDLCDQNGPNASSGIVGIPYSGSTFLAGLHGIMMSTLYYHEGIMQQVNGFNPGCSYKLTFYQSVVKQNNYWIDESGSWAFYLDSNLISVSTPSFSTKAYNDINLDWEYREISFIATNSSHLIALIPQDDDSDINSPDAVRMGIDMIEIQGNTRDPINLYDTVQCLSQGITLNAPLNFGPYLWNDSSTNAALEIFSQGIYYVNSPDSCGAYANDSFNIMTMERNSIQLYDSMCTGEELTLSAPFGYGNYNWNNGSTNSQITVSNQGVYWVESPDSCGSIAKDTFYINTYDCSPTNSAIYLPTAFSPNKDGFNDHYTVRGYGIKEMELNIYDRFGTIVFSSDNLNNSWDGRTNGQEQNQGVYIYYIRYLFENETKFKTKKGNITLIR